MGRDAHFLELQFANMPEPRKVVAPVVRTLDDKDAQDDAGRTPADLPVPII